MTEDRISQAMERIERALARIETQAALSGSAGGGARADAELAARHEALRESVAASISELDSLIGGLDK